MTHQELERVHQLVVYGQPDLMRKLSRFWILLVLAAAISTLGLLSDSVATVIGAMIVAPLMMPIVGLGFGISVGSGRAILVCLAVSLGGIVTSVGVGFLISLLMTSSFDPEQVGQIMSRTSPGLVDMLAALATGLAGGFAIARKDVSDTLPGVAIAIALVPPLTNAGILFGTGRTDLAFGSLLLFLTNYLAIVLTATIIFGAMGYPVAAMQRRTSRGKRIALTVVVLMFLVIAGPLGYQTMLTVEDRTAVDTATTATEEWLKNVEYSIVSVRLDDSQDYMSVVIEGSGDLPDVQDLSNSLKGELLGLDVVLKVVPAEQVRVSTQ